MCVLKGLNSHRSLFLLIFPKTKLFLCNRATIEVKDYFNRGAWYNMRGKKIICVLPQCQRHCSVFGNCSRFYLGRLQDDLEVQCWQPWFREGASLWASEHSSSAVNPAATHYPQGKAEQMVFLSLPPATLKERDIFCSICVAQGQNLQSWLPPKPHLS